MRVIAELLKSSSSMIPLTESEASTFASALKIVDPTVPGGIPEYDDEPETNLRASAVLSQYGAAAAPSPSSGAGGSSIRFSETEKETVEHTTVEEEDPGPEVIEKPSEVEEAPKKPTM